MEHRELAGVTVLASVSGGSAASPIVVMIVSVAFMALYVAAIWAQLALGVKRLHDRNSSGWRMLLGVVPLGGFVLLVMLGFLDGTQGSNKHGPSPKGIVDRELGSIFQ